MKTGFKDPIAIKEGKKIKSPWNYDQPSYDERTSCYVNAGTNYGVGHRNPIGHKDGGMSQSPMLPKGRVNTLETNYRHKDRMSNVEIERE